MVATSKKEISFDGLPVKDVWLDLSVHKERIKVSELEDDEYNAEGDSIIIAKTPHGLQIDFAKGSVYLSTQLINWNVIDRIFVLRRSYYSK